MNYAEIISKIRDEDVVSEEEIHAMVSGITDGSLSDAQLGAFAMVVLWRGLSDQNSVALTTSMRDSGQVLEWDVSGPIVDKHSTGGVGDCVSLALAPILAAAGLYVPMISGRGLGHTGGTLDKLQSIPGFNIHLDEEQMSDQLREIGCVMAGASAKIAPADKRFYAIRDVTGTVPSIDLITASILSKKLAAGLDYLVLDVKCGLGAFMKTQSRAEALAKKLVQVSNDMGCQTSALITAMDVPLAQSAGNALEVKEIMALLEGNGADTRLYEVTKALCVELMEAVDMENAEHLVDEIIDSGEAMERFEDMVAAQGGPKGVDAIRQSLPEAPLIVDFIANDDMDFYGFDAYEVGMCVVGLGGGRTQMDDELDYAVGISDIVAPYHAKRGDVLARIHANNEDALERAEERLYLSILQSPSSHELIIGGVN